MINMVVIEDASFTLAIKNNKISEDIFLVTIFLLIQL